MSETTYKWGDHVVLDCGDPAIVRSEPRISDQTGELIVCVNRFHYGGGETTGYVPVSRLCHPAPRESGGEA